MPVFSFSSTVDVIIFHTGHLKSTSIYIFNQSSSKLLTHDLDYLRPTLFQIHRKTHAGNYARGI